MKNLFLILGLLVFGCLGLSRAAMITAASTSRADVGTAYTAAANGDTIQIPAGTSDWSSLLTVSKAVRFMGAGTNSTIIRDAMTTDAPFLIIETSSLINTQVTIGDIQFAQASGSGRSTWYSGWYHINGCNTNNTYVIVTNIYANGSQGPTPFVEGAIGVMTKCVWNITGGIGLYVYHENWGGYTFSSGSFSLPVEWGTDKFWYVEDSIIRRGGAAYAFTDAYRGARYVVRYSDLTYNWLELHGTDSGRARRGTRAIESYLNAFHGDGSSTYAHNFRSATGVIWSNTVDNMGTAVNFIYLDAYRRLGPYTPFGEANGNNVWDRNNASNPFATGTATSGGLRSLTDSGKSWTTDQWVGYQLTRTSPLNSAETEPNTGFITANTATTITVAANVGGAFSDITYATGDTYQINRVTEAFDQPGVQDSVNLTYRANTDFVVSANVVTVTLTSHGLTTGDWVSVADVYCNAVDITTHAQVTVTTANAFTFPYTLANSTAALKGYTAKIPTTMSQTDDPSYEWGNVKEGGVDLDFHVIATLMIRENEHYYNDTPKPGYTPLAYPHPLLRGNRNVIVNGNGRVNGNVIFGQ